jgi:hypothetical protein
MNKSQHLLTQNGCVDAGVLLTFVQLKLQGNLLDVCVDQILVGLNVEQFILSTVDS